MGRKTEIREESEEMKRLIGGIVLFLALLASLAFTTLTGFQPPEPSWQNPVIGIAGAVVLGWVIGLIGYGWTSMKK